MNSTLKMQYIGKEVSFPAARDSVAEQEDYFQKDPSSQAELFESEPVVDGSPSFENVSSEVPEAGGEVEDEGTASFASTVSQLVQMTNGELLYVIDKDPEEIDEKPDIQNED